MAGTGTTIVIETGFGEIVVELADAEAPITTANFLRYLDAGMYDGGAFHRTVRLDNQSNANLRIETTDMGIATSGGEDARPNDAIAIEVIQGGVDPARVAGLGDPIPLERTGMTGLRHGDGAISMARLTPDSAVSDFFICINDQPELDEGGRRNLDGQGFAAFGRVTSGMDVVRTIQSQPADGQSLTPRVDILHMRRTGGTR